MFNQRRLLLIALTATQLLACAHQEPDVTHTIQILDPPIQQTRPALGDFTLHNLALGPHHIQADITYEPHCYTLVLDQIEHNKIYTRQKHADATILLGSVLAAATNEGLTDSTDRITNKDDYHYSSNDPSVTVLGGLFLASEILARNLTHTPVTLRWTNIEERHRSPKHTCTTPPPPGGTISFFHHDTLIAQTHTNPTTSLDTIDLDLQTIPELCNNPALHGQPIHITYTPHD